LNPDHLVGGRSGSTRRRRGRSSKRGSPGPSA
jgi:hypothetical protein